MSCCSSFTYVHVYNLKHMGKMYFLCVSISFHSVYVLRVMHIHTHANHAVLIIRPTGDETHPFPICCTPSVKIFLLICNNSLQTFLQRGPNREGNTVLSEPQPLSSRVGRWLQRSACYGKVTSLNPTTDSTSINSRVEDPETDLGIKTGRPAGVREYSVNSSSGET